MDISINHLDGEFYQPISNRHHSLSFNHHSSKYKKSIKQKNQHFSEKNNEETWVV